MPIDDQPSHFWKHREAIRTYCFAATKCMHHAKPSVDEFNLKLGRPAPSMSYTVAMSWGACGYRTRKAAKQGCCQWQRADEESD
jgi:hypothetical protein